MDNLATASQLIGYIDQADGASLKPGDFTPELRSSHTGIVIHGKDGVMVSCQQNHSCCVFYVYIFVYDGNRKGVGNGAKAVDLVHG